MNIVEIQELLEEALEKIDTLESRLEEYKYHFKDFAEPPVLDGIDLRTLV